MFVNKLLFTPLFINTISNRDKNSNNTHNAASAIDLNTTIIITQQMNKHCRKNNHLSATVVSIEQARTAEQELHQQQLQAQFLEQNWLRVHLQQQRYNMNVKFEKKAS